MSDIDVEKLLAPVSDDAPAGAEVEYDPEYFELEKLAQGTPESVVGEEVMKPAEEPNWSEVKEAALKLSERTRDLRVAMILSVSLLKENGLSGFEDGTKLLKGFVEQLWEQFYPKLDPDDNNDPTIRVNILKNLNGDGSSADMYKFKNRLKEAILTNSQKRIGKFSYRDIQVAKGEVSPPAAKAGEAAPTAPDMAIINAAFEDTTTEDLLAEQANLEGAISNLKELDKSLQEKIGAGGGPDVQPLNELLGQIKGVIDEQLANRGVGAEAPPEEGGGEALLEGSEGSAPVARAAALSGEIANRQDVIRALDKICNYYEKYEPGSPVPIFMKRAKRLVTMSFVDVIKDLAPDANDRINIFVGESAEQT
ncbi:MAG TPA: type VI secretion system protein TssA [Phycisphaerae bacterium]|jgi:type VI secretion system protein ImpA|nr:type VI secretion system protein TssA [Phycisphaerae bacterium]